MQDNFQVGECLIEPQLNSITRGEKAARVEPKVMQVLMCLARHTGELVTKEELFRAVWPDTFVGDDVLTRSISELRKVFDDDAKEPRFIQTIPRSGYRLIAPVSYSATQRATLLSEVESVQVVIEEHEEGRGSLPAGVSTPRRHLTLNRIVLAAAVLLVAAYAAVLFIRSRHAKTSVANKTIAVLPFKSLAAGGEDEYLGLGMADALITRLSGLNGIVVRPTMAVRKYAAANSDLSEASRELQVDSVLDGTIQRLGTQLRITVQLVSVKEGRSLWTQKFDEKLTDMFKVEDSISEQVARALALKLTGDERTMLAKHSTENSQAYQDYLKGRYHWNKRTEEGLRKALDYFQKAIDADSTFAEAYAGMADDYLLLGEVGVIPGGESASKGREAAMKALTLDNTLAEAHASLGLLKKDYEWDFAGAEQELLRAIELNPNYAMARSWYSTFLTAVGRWEEARAQMKRAQELDPVTPIITTNAGWALYMAHRGNEAEAEYRKVLELDPNFSGSHRGLGWCYELQRAYPEAVAEFQKALLLDVSPYNLVSLAHAYAVSGNRVEVQKAIQRLNEQSKQNYVPSYFRAAVSAGLGERDQALEWLNKSYAEHSGLLTFVKVDPWFDDLHSDSRFQDLLRRIGLES